MKSEKEKNHDYLKIIFILPDYNFLIIYFIIIIFSVKVIMKSSFVTRSLEIYHLNWPLIFLRGSVNTVHNRPPSVGTGLSRTSVMDGKGRWVGANVVRGRSISKVSLGKNIGRPERGSPSRSGQTNGQIKRMANFETNGQNLDFYHSANGHGHSPKLKSCKRRMAMAIH